MLRLEPVTAGMKKPGLSPASLSDHLLASLDNNGIDAAVLTLPTYFVAEEKGYRVVGDPTRMPSHVELPSGVTDRSMSYPRTS